MAEKLTDSDRTLDTGTTVIRPVKSLRDLGVHLDSELTMKTHVSKVVSSCYHQLHRILQVCRLVAQQLTPAFILSRLDYCNSLKYLSDCVFTVSAASGRYQLRSTGSAVYVLPRTRTRLGERGFFYSGPAA